MRASPFTEREFTRLANWLPDKPKKYNADFCRALRNEYIVDPQGREVRKHHPVISEVKTYDIGVIIAMPGLGMIFILFVTDRLRKMPAHIEEGAAHFKIPYVDFSIQGTGFSIGVLGGFAVIASGMALAIWYVSHTSP